MGFSSKIMRAFVIEVSYACTDDSNLFLFYVKCIIVKHLHENDVGDDLMLMIMILA